jgi:hypothetical protein
MDAMALLCTLHADGPATLKRLREAGCASIETTLTLDVERLARLLDATPAAARRFQREAGHLCARLDTGFLEREPRPAEPHTREALELTTPASATSTAPAGTTEAAAAKPAHAPTKPVIGFRDRRIVEQVLRAWRERDGETENEAQADPQRSAHEPGAADDGPAEAARAIHPDQRADSALAPAIEPSAATGGSDETGSGGDLFPGAVDGLDQDTCLRLRQAGVRDVELLAGADVLALSRTLGVGYTRLARLCALARRALARSTSPSTGAADLSTESRQAARFAHESSDVIPHAPRSATFDPARAVKFSHCAQPSVDRLPALARDLEATSEPRAALPSLTRWSAAPASVEGDTPGGPFV